MGYHDVGGGWRLAKWPSITSKVPADMINRHDDPQKGKVGVQLIGNSTNLWVTRPDLAQSLQSLKKSQDMVIWTVPLLQLKPP